MVIQSTRLNCADILARLCEVVSWNNFNLASIADSSIITILQLTILSSSSWPKNLLLGWNPPSAAGRYLPLILHYFQNWSPTCTDNDFGTEKMFRKMTTVLTVMSSQWQRPQANKCIKLIETWLDSGFWGQQWTIIWLHSQKSVTGTLLFLWDVIWFRFCSLQKAYLMTSVQWPRLMEITQIKSPYPRT